MAPGSTHPGGAGAIFFLTDYGQRDELAGVVRAVLARTVPGVPVVDLTHDIEAFDVRAGALALERAAPHLGPGVVLAVVDPGVGTGRRAVALELGSHGGPRAMVGPDNGLLCRAADVLGGAVAAVALPAASGEGRATFDGRDVFAPAAASLWDGASVGDLGPALDPASLVRLPEPFLELGEDVVEAEVLWVDRFGNVELAASAADGRRAGLGMGDQLRLRAGPLSAPATMVRAFDDLGAAPAGGEPPLGLLVDANGRLALVCPRSSAATVLGVRAGDVVNLQRVPGAV